MVNSLRPSDAVWHQGYWSILVQVMAGCLMAQSQYLNQWWLILSIIIIDMSCFSFLFLFFFCFFILDLSLSALTFIWGILLHIWLVTMNRFFFCSHWRIGAKISNPGLCCRELIRTSALMILTWHSHHMQYQLWPCCDRNIKKKI